MACHEKKTHFPVKRAWNNAETENIMERFRFLVAVFAGTLFYTLIAITGGQRRVCGPPVPGLLIICHRSASGHT